MSDVLLTGLDDFDFGDSNISNNQNKKAGDKKITLLKVIVLVLAILLLLEAVLYTFVIPCLAPAKIRLYGLTTISTKQVSSIIQPMNSKTWAQFNCQEACSLLSSVPGIDTVIIDKHFPDKVDIQIKERKPVAKTIVTIDNHLTPVQIDANGVLFPAITSDAIVDKAVPLVSGLPVDNVQGGMRIPEKYRSLMEQISDIQSLSQNYFAAISEIQVVPKEYGNYELVLYPVNSRIKVLTDRTLNEDALKYMMVVLDVVNSIEPDVSEVDLRYGSVSYRKR